MQVNFKPHASNSGLTVDTILVRLSTVVLL
jgi:hypothetical protein